LVVSFAILGVAGLQFLSSGTLEPHGAAALLQFCPRDQIFSNLTNSLVGNYKIMTPLPCDQGALQRLVPDSSAIFQHSSSIQACTRLRFIKLQGGWLAVCAVCEYPLENV